LKTNQHKKGLLFEVSLIIGLSIILAFAYNIYSGKGIPIIRKAVQKVVVEDSVLFKHFPTVDSVHENVPQDIKVIAPLHERALRNPDSMANLYKDKKNPVYKIITMSQFTRLISEKKGIIFDARSNEEYVKGHVRGAHNIPADEAINHFEELLPLPRDTLILIYCNGPECHLGHMLADFLVTLDFKNMYIFDGGWEEWVNSKMPIDTTIVKD